MYSYVRRLAAARSAALPASVDLSLQVMFKKDIQEEEDEEAITMIVMSAQLHISPLHKEERTFTMNAIIWSVICFGTFCHSTPPDRYSLSLSPSQLSQAK